MSAAVDIKGLKRVCAECGIRFYDMNKRPITCPSCSTEYTGAVKNKGRRGKIAEATEAEAEKKAKEAAAAKKAAEDEDDLDEEPDAAAEELNLDEAATTEAAGDDDAEVPVVVEGSMEGLDEVELDDDGAVIVDADDSDDDEDED